MPAFYFCLCEFLSLSLPEENEQDEDEGVDGNGNENSWSGVNSPVNKLKKRRSWKLEEIFRKIKNTHPSG